MSIDEIDELLDYFNTKMNMFTINMSYDNNKHFNSPYSVYIPTVKTKDKNRLNILSKNLKIYLNNDENVYCILFINYNDIFDVHRINIFIDNFYNEYNIKKDNIGVILYKSIYEYTHVGVARCAIAQFIVRTYKAMVMSGLKNKPIIISDDRRYIQETSKIKLDESLNNKIKNMLEYVMQNDAIISPLGQRCKRTNEECRTDVSISQIIVSNIQNIVKIYIWALKQNDNSLCSFFTVLFEDSAFINAAYKSSIVNILGFTDLKRVTSPHIKTIARKSFDYELTSFDKKCLNKAIDYSVSKCKKPFKGICMNWGNEKQQEIKNDMNSGYSAHYQLLKKIKNDKDFTNPIFIDLEDDEEEEKSISNEDPIFIDSEDEDPIFIDSESEELNNKKRNNDNSIDIDSQDEIKSNNRNRKIIKLTHEIISSLENPENRRRLLQ